MVISGGIGLSGPEALRPPTAAVLQLKLPLVLLSEPSRDPQTSSGDMWGWLSITDAIWATAGP